MPFQLTVASIEFLPSQFGKRGRPRKHGRAHVSLGECASHIYHGEDLVQHIRQCVADFYGAKLSEIPVYRRECSAETASFVVPVAADVLVRFSYKATE